MISCWRWKQSYGTIHERKNQSMNLTEEQIKNFQKRVLNAKSKEEVVAIVKEMGVDTTVEEIDQFLENAPKNLEPLKDEELEAVVGGVNAPDIPQYDAIKKYYEQKGPNPAFILCIYYIPSPICYEIIQVIESGKA